MKIELIFLWFNAVEYSYELSNNREDGKIFTCESYPKDSNMAFFINNLREIRNRSRLYNGITHYKDYSDNFFYARFDIWNIAAKLNARSPESYDAFIIRETDVCNQCDKLKVKGNVREVYPYYGFLEPETKELLDSKNIEYFNMGDLSNGKKICIC